MKTLSIITVTFNSEKTLERTIESIITQKSPEIEFIVIDGNSKDRTVEIIKKYEHYIDYWISEKDKGIYDAMSKGVQKASGKYIAFMNSNDWYKENILTPIVGELQRTEDEIVYGDTEVYLNDVSAGVMLAGEISGTEVYHMPFCHQSSFIKKSTFEKYKGFDPRFKYLSDYELLLRILKDNGRAKKINHAIANYSLGGVSSDFKKASLERVKIQKLHKFNPLKIIYAYLSWNFTGTIRTIVTPEIELKLRKIRNSK